MQTAIASYRSACILKFCCGLHRKLQHMLDSWIFRDWVKNWGHVVNCGLLCHGVNVSCSHWHQAWPAWNSLAMSRRTPCQNPQKVWQWGLQQYCRCRHDRVDYGRYRFCLQLCKAWWKLLRLIVNSSPAPWLWVSAGSLLEDHTCRRCWHSRYDNAMCWV